MTDDELMHAIANYDQRAFTTLVERHLDALYAYARRLTGSPDLAEDLLQDVWLTIWEKAVRYKPGKVRFTTWLYRVLQNRHIDVIRRRKPVYDTDFVELQTFQGEFDNQHELHQRFSAFEQALGALPESQRAALLLAHVHGFTNKEVAHILQLSVRAVESLQARGRRGLLAAERDRIEDKHSESMQRHNHD